MLYRYLLLFLLPVIAIVLYFDGQDYDPELLKLQTDQNNNSLISAYLPEQNGTYQRVGQIRHYSKENLYEYINGHAEYFISFGFIKLAVADYSSEVPEKNTPEFVVDIYDMGKIESSFGILMGESGENFTPLEIGFRGFLTQKTLNFVKGPYYIKISAYNESAPIVKFARELEKLLGDHENSIPQIEKFPKSGSVSNSVRFFKENYNGLSFVSNVFEQEYKVEGENFKVFLIEGNNDKISNLLKKYINFFKEESIEYKTLYYENRKYYTILDPFEGDWHLIPFDKNLFGIYGSISDGVLIKFIETLERDFSKG